MKHLTLALVWALCHLMALPSAWAHGEPAHAISQSMKQQFERPDAPLTVAPIVVLGEYAVAAWEQTGQGGRALLQKVDGQWHITLCAGAGLTQADVLESTGMKKEAATALAQAVRSAESGLDVAKRKRFDSFEGMVKVGIPGANAGHGAHAMHGHAPAHGDATKH